VSESRNSIARLVARFIFKSVSAFHGGQQDVAPLPFAPSVEKYEQRVARLDNFVREEIRSANIPGLSIALVQGGKLAWTKGYGVTNWATRQPVEADTCFEAASLGKPITAYAALRLADEGLLDLEHPLSNYLKTQFVDDVRRREGMTARTVLTHTSGLSNDLQERHHRAVFEAGERFSYSGVGFMYLQKVIEEVSRMPFDRFMRETVFVQLGMTSSSYLRRSQMARGHVHLGGLAAPLPFFPAEQPNAANLLCSTAADLARFEAELMAPTLVSPALVDEMLSPQVQIRGDAWWGLGIGLLLKESTKCFWHWGDNLDFESYMLGCPGERIGAVVMTNSSRGLRVARRIAAKALGG